MPITDSWVDNDCFMMPIGKLIQRGVPQGYMIGVGFFLFTLMMHNI
jgi:DHA2 family multidrug resistance protein